MRPIFKRLFMLRNWIGGSKSRAAYPYCKCNACRLGQVQALPGKKVCPVGLFQNVTF